MCLKTKANNQESNQTRIKSFVMTSERTFVYTIYRFWDGILNSAGIKHLHDFAIL